MQKQPEESDADLYREVVCPDRNGVGYPDCMTAAHTLRGMGWKDATSVGVLKAIRDGSEYCGCHWGWRCPTERKG